MIFLRGHYFPFTTKQPSIGHARFDQELSFGSKLVYISAIIPLLFLLIVFLIVLAL